MNRTPHKLQEDKNKRNLPLPNKPIHTVVVILQSEWDVLKGLNHSLIY